MLTLQSTFKYDCNTTPPSDQVEITLSYPRFEPATPETSTSPDAPRLAAAPIPLVPVGRGSLVFPQFLAEKRYSVSIPTGRIFGDNYGASLVNHLQSLLGLTQNIRPKLADFTLSFSASYGGDAQEAVRPIDGLYFFKALVPFKPEPRISFLPVADTHDTPPTREPLESQASGHADDDDSIGARFAATATAAVGREAIIDANIYCVSKPAYLRVLKEIFLSLPTDNESILLYIINTLVELNGSFPVLTEDTEATARQRIATVLAAFNLSANVDVYAHVTKNFSFLFDFALTMPCVKLLSVAGKLRINAPQGVKVTNNDFFLYHLRSEFTTGTADAPARNVRRYQWDREKVETDSINFTFTELQVVQSRVRGLVTVTVKGFDGTELWTTELRATDPALQQLDIVLDLRLPDLLNNPTGTSTGPNLNKKLRGKAVSLAKRCGGLKGVVVVQAQKSTTEPWITVASGESDKDGNFTLAYPSGKFTAAQAISSLDPYSVTALVTNAQAAEDSISTDFIFILLVTGDAGKDGKADSSCGCSAQHAAGRLPSQEDLIQSDQYTQDVGGTCLNLTTPNRLLREYSYTALVRTSDPDVANYTLSFGTDANGRRSFTVQGHGKVKRNAIDLDNPILWEDAPGSRGNLSLYQAVTVATGHILYYRSEFRADGYSLGDLLYSLPLAPGQKKQMVVMDSRHDLVGAETQSITQSESLASNLVNERSIVDQIAGSLGETLAGRSSASTEGVSAGGGAAGSYGGMVGGSIGVSGGYSKSSSSSSQTGKRDLSQYFSEVLRHDIMQKADSYRQLNASVVTAVREGQQYSAETSVVANHNHCHSITMMYFEVLRHFAVFQELVDVQECVFVPLLMTRFSMENIPRWRDVLATSLRPTPSNTYLKPYTFFSGRPQHPLLPAFDALERVKTNWTQVDYPLTTFDREPIRWVEGELVLNTSIPRPKTKWDFILSLPIFTKTITREVTDFRSVAKSTVAAIFTGGLSLLAGDDGSRTETAEVLARAKVFDHWFDLDETYQTVRPKDCIRFKGFESYTVPILGSLLDPITINIGPDDRRMWIFMARALGYSEPKDEEAVRHLLTYYYKGQLLAEWDTLYVSQIAPRVFKAIVNQLSIDFASLDFTPLSNYNGGERRMRIAFSGTSAKPRFEIDPIYLSCRLTGLSTLGTSPIILNIVSLRVAYSTQHYRGLLYSGAVNGDLWDG